MTEEQDDKPVGSDKSPYPERKSSKQRPAYDLLDPNSEEYRCISAEIVVYDDMIEEKKALKREPTERDFKAAAQRLWEDYHVKLHFNGVKKRFRRYVAEGRDGLRKKQPGPVAGDVLTPKQHQALEGLCVKRYWNEVERDGVKYFSIRQGDLGEIYKEVLRVPGGNKVSESTIYRAVQRFLKSHRSDVILAHQGANQAVMQTFPKKPNNVAGANARWQYDLRFTKNFVRVGDEVYQIIAGCIIDDFTQDPIDCQFFTRKEEFDDETKLVDATTLFACRQVANAIDVHQLMPPKMYTDNGPAFRKLFKARLKEIGIDLTNSIPRYPPGRGKVENFLKLLDKILKEIAGYVENGSRDNMEEVLAHPIPTLEFFLEQVHEKLDKIRKSPPRKGGKESRHDIWKNGESYALPPPSPEKLVVFANTVEQVPARLYDKGVYWKYVFYVPVKRTENLDLLWSRTVGKKIPLRLATLRDQLVAFASFDGRTWIPVEPREQSDRGVNEHMKYRGANKKKIREANRVRVATLDAIMAEIHQGTTIDAFLEQNAPGQIEPIDAALARQEQREEPEAAGEENETPVAFEQLNGNVQQTTPEGEEVAQPVGNTKRSKGFSAGLREMFRQKPSGSDK